MDIYRKIKNNAGIIITIILMFCSISCANDKNLEDISSMIEVNYTFLSKDITLGEPILIDFNVKNISEKTIVIDLGAQRMCNFKFEIERLENDKVVFRDANQLEIGGSGPPTKVSVNPKESYSQILILNEWFQIPSKGDYKVVVELKSKELKFIYAPKKELRFMIKSKNPEKLEIICEKLKNEAISQNSAEAIKILSNVCDDVAIQYKMDVINTMPNNSYVYNIVEGFKRVNTMESAHALAKLLSNKDNNIKRVAKIELLLMQNLTLDNEILGFLEGVLKGEKLPKGSVYHKG